MKKILKTNSKPLTEVNLGYYYIVFGSFCQNPYIGFVGFYITLLISFFVFIIVLFYNFYHFFGYVLWTQN